MQKKYRLFFLTRSGDLRWVVGRPLYDSEEEALGSLKFTTGVEYTILPVYTKLISK